MGSEFNRMLNEALEGVGPEAAGPSVSSAQFLNFINAIVASSDQTRVDAALARAATLDPQQLASVISQTTSLGSLHGLRAAVQSKPERATAIMGIAERMFPVPSGSSVDSTNSPLYAVLSELGVAGQYMNKVNPPVVPPPMVNPPSPVAAASIGGEDEDEEDDYYDEEDDYYDEGDDDDGHGGGGDDEDEEEEFDQEGDYYSQGNDGGGH